MATVRANAHFDPEDRAKELQQAMKGRGTNEKVIIDILTSHNNDQRQKIKHAFKELFNKDLAKELEKETKGNFEDILVALLDTPEEFAAKEIHRALKGRGTDEATLIEILCTRTNKEIKEISRKYEDLFNRDMESHIESETSGAFGKLLTLQSKGARDESSSVDESQVREDAEAIFKAGEGQRFTDESTFSRILTQRSFRELRAIFKAYHKLAGNSIVEAIKTETKGDLQKAYLSIVGCVIDIPAYFATVLLEAVGGIGTKEAALTRVIVSRSEIDLADIVRAFEVIHPKSKSLGEVIRSECKGDYEAILLRLID